MEHLVQIVSQIVVEARVKNAVEEILNLYKIWVESFGHPVVLEVGVLQLLAGLADQPMGAVFHLAEILQRVVRVPSAVLLLRELQQLLQFAL